MGATTTATGLVQTWVAVTDPTDPSGRPWLEAHWVDASAASAGHVTHAA
jgi:hypothetical protein